MVSITHSSSNSVNGGIILTNVTGETVDLSKYLEFGLYEKFWFKDNAGLSPGELGSWLGISRRTGMLMCYHILIHTGKVISRYMVQWVTNIGLSNDEVKEIFVKFDAEIRRSLNSYNREYYGSKPIP